MERAESVSTVSGLINLLLIVPGAGDDNINLSAEAFNSGATAFLDTGLGNDTVTMGDIARANVFTGDGDDIINGGAQGGVYEGGAGGDIITGGSGSADIVDYRRSDAAVSVDLGAGTASGGHAQGDVLSGIERLLGSIYDDALTGTAADNFLSGSDGSDTLNGGAGADRLRGGEGADILTGGQGDDIFDYNQYSGAFSDEITDFELGDVIELSQAFENGQNFMPAFIGTTAFSAVAGELRYEKVGGETLLQLDIDGDGTADETLTISNGEFDLQVVNNTGFSFSISMAPPPIDGTSGDDVLVGTPGDDIINGFEGNDTITTFEGTDTVDAGTGDDIVIVSLGVQGTIDGGEGYDTLRLSTATPPPQGGVIGSPDDLAGFQNAGILLPNFERVELINSATDEYFSLSLLGTDANDSLDISGENIESGGFFYTATGDGDDVITVGTNTDVNVSVWAGLGDDTITVGDLGSFIYGGAGFDFVSYQFSPVGVSVDLSAGTAVGGEATGDVLTAIEGLRGSDFGNNSLTGDAGDNVIDGGALSDVLGGGAGNDTLIGGLGVDTMTGGAGNDVFLTIGNYEGGFTGTITDFEDGDVISGTVNFQGPSGFFPITWIGEAAFSGVVGELRYEKTGGQTLLHMDTSGDGTANETLTISNGEFDLINTSPNSDDFLLVIPATVTPNLVTTVNDEIAENTNLLAQGNDGTGLSLREAIAIANATAGADVISFDAALAGQDAGLSGQISITDDLTIDGDSDGDGLADITIQGAPDQFSRLFEIDTASISIVNEANINVDTSGFTGFSRENVFSFTEFADNVTFTNQGTITQSGDPAQPNFDNDIAINVLGDNFTFINEAGASIVTEGRSAISALGGYLPDGVGFTTNIINNGLLEAGDDTIRITSGTITNNGTIRTTGTYDFGVPDFNPGYAADGIAVFGVNEATTSLPAEGVSHIINSATGIIEGARSGVSSGGGTVENAGYISGESVAIWAQGHGIDGLASTYTVENTGTLERLGENYGLNGGPEVYAAIFVGANIDSVSITNSGDILSPDLAISGLGAGTSLTNTASGQILSDTDGTGDDGVAFRGALQDDFIVEGRVTFPSLPASGPLENTQGITVDSNGDLEIPGIGTFPFWSGSTQYEVASVGSDNFLLPLVDLTATQNNGFVTYVRDANGPVFAASIDVPAADYGIITVSYVSGSGFTVTDSNGAPLTIIDLPDNLNDFADTINNAGIIEGDIFTGIGDDTITNTGVIIGIIDVGAGDDVVRAGDGNTTVYGGAGADTLVGQGGDDILFGGSGDDYFSGGTGADIINGGAGDDLAYGGADNDIVNGDAGDDNLFGGSGDDELNGGAGRDTLVGQSGNDTLNGGGSADTLVGGADDDILNGGSGTDSLFGQSGDDTQRRRRC